MNKKAALELISAAGAFAPFRWITRGDALVLMYHRFGESNDGVTVPPESFARQVAYLNAHYRIVPLTTIADYLKAGERLPRGLAVITVDDGYNDFYEAAFPILRKEGVTATVFLVTDFVSQRAWMPADRAAFLTAQAAGGEYQLAIGRERLRIALGEAASRDAAAARINTALLAIPHEERTEAVGGVARALDVPLPIIPPKEFGALHWGQVREMAMAGIEFGSHTVTHAMLTQISEVKMRREVAESRAQIEDELGRTSDIFSYPNGEMNDRVREAVVRAGYRGAGSSAPGFNDAQVDPFAIRRIYAETDLPHFVQTTSGCEHLKNQLRNFARI
ncbi:MAG: polysaccharide deacetylase family protein [Blastocatellia bacterium]